MVIDFNAAAARIKRLAEQHTTYVDVEFSTAELAPRPTLFDMLQSCIADVDAFGVREELLK